MDVLDKTTDNVCNNISINCSRNLQRYFLNYRITDFFHFSLKIKFEKQTREQERMENTSVSGNFDSS